jgi:hypothetical protein
MPENQERKRLPPVKGGKKIRLASFKGQLNDFKDCFKVPLDLPLLGLIGFF